jgi:hypothetical protein
MIALIPAFALHKATASPKIKPKSQVCAASSCKPAYLLAQNLHRALR